MFSVLIIFLLVYPMRFLQYCWQNTFDLVKYIAFPIKDKCALTFLLWLGNFIGLVIFFCHHFFNAKILLIEALNWNCKRSLGLYAEYEFNPNIAVAFNTEAHRHRPNEMDRAQEIPKRLDSIREKLEEFQLLPQMVEFNVDKVVFLIQC